MHFVDGDKDALFEKMEELVLVELLTLIKSKLCGIYVQ